MRYEKMTFLMFPADVSDVSYCTHDLMFCPATVPRQSRRSVPGQQIDHRQRRGTKLACLVARCAALCQQARFARLLASKKRMRVRTNNKPNPSFAADDLVLSLPKGQLACFAADYLSKSP